MQRPPSRPVEEPPMFRQLETNLQSRFPWGFSLTAQPTSGINGVFLWCHEQFGEGFNCWAEAAPNGTRWIFNGTSGFAFRYEDDAFAFKMRWC